PHVSSGVRSAGCNLIATLVFGMSETIAITGKSVKLFKGHYTRSYFFNFLRKVARLIPNICAAWVILPPA
ncbi:MAG: hypothetical protein ACREYE_31855, partial [Gammaproteobacteria bacterium]